MIGSGDLGFGLSFTLVDNFSDNAGRIREGFVGLEDGVTKLGAKAFIFNEIKQAVENVTSVLDQFADGYIELDKQVKNIGSLGVEGFEEYAALATKLSKDVPDSAGQIAEGVYEAISSGITGSKADIMEFTRVASEAGVAGLSNTQAAVSGLTSVMNSYKLGISDAQRVSDTFFGAINLGKTTFEEMNRAVANVVPNASAAGIGFDQVAAGIAQMTSLGVPTAMASTQMRQAIVEIQKPGKELAAVMAAVGLNAGNIVSVIKEKGLFATLQQIEGGAQKLGVSMTQAFSSTEAASAALLLTGDNAQRANETLAGIQQQISTGAASKAFDVASQSIDVKFRIIQNRIAAHFKGFFDLIGTSGVVALKTFNQYAPAITTLAMTVPMLTTAWRAFQATTFMTTLTNAGLTASLSAVAAAAWAALAPLLPFIAAGVALVAAYILVKESIAEFNAVLDGSAQPATGFLGFMQKIGGVIEGVAEIWQSWNGETFTLSQGMHDALEKMGILDFVLALGTWAVRIKEFFGGIGEMLGTIWGIASKVWGAISAAFDTISEKVAGVGMIFGKATAPINLFSLLGKAIGVLIGVVLVPLFTLITVAITAFKVAVLGIQLAFTFLLDVVGYGISIFNAFLNIIYGVWDAIVGFWRGLWEGATAAWEAFSGFGNMFIQVGAAIVGGLKQGLLGAWDGLKNMMVNLIAGLPGGAKILAFLGVEAGGDNVNLNKQTGGAKTMAQVQSRQAQAQAQAVAKTPTVVSNTTEKQVSHTTVLQLDGRVLGEATTQYNQDQNDRD